MKQLTKALLVNAIKHGAIDWSVLIQKCLRLTWQSAPSCHGGDAAVSRYADDNERAVYQDVLTKVLDGTDAPTNAPSLDGLGFTQKSRFGSPKTRGKAHMPGTGGRRAVMARRNVTILDVIGKGLSLLSLAIDYSSERHGETREEAEYSQTYCPGRKLSSLSFTLQSL